MLIEKRTTSLCPECMAEIGAVVQVSNSSVVMNKQCPEHGPFQSVIEKDPIFYMLGNQLDRNNIYNGLFVDVTNRCNTTCKYCYHDTNDSEPTAETILAQCRENSQLAPFVLVGGEPTVRTDLPELMRDIRKIGPVMLSTNGIKLADKEYVRCLDALLWPDIFNVNISVHPEENNAPGDYDKKMQAIDNILSTGLILYGMIFVIDDLSQIDEAIYVNRYFNKRIIDTRLKIATEINQTSTGSDIFNSDVYNHLYNKAKSEQVQFDINHNAFNKHAYFNMTYDGINLTAVKWYTKHNVDLADIDCGPWHKNKDGRILNMDHSLILGG